MLISDLEAYSGTSGGGPLAASPVFVSNEGKLPRRTVRGENAVFWKKWRSVFGQPQTAAATPFTFMQLVLKSGAS